MLANPFVGVKVRGAPQATPFDTTRSLTEDEWLLIRAIANDLEPSRSWSAPAAQRLRFLLDFSYATGLRAHELMTATLGDITCAPRGEAWLRVTGKGAQEGKVALPPVATDALERSLVERGLPVTQARWTPHTLLIPNLATTGESPITPTRRRQITHRLFRTSPACSKPTGPRWPPKFGVPARTGCGIRMRRTRWIGA
ncbi:integrase [Paraburkholderia bryophila]|uniref:Integrase n=1 Tax=Paraburkholderia bryophila TaxID=420952 RepID=A0A7Y9WSH2_9BURK|nr:integrase [Paraburkholderia bryophila]